MTGRKLPDLPLRGLTQADGRLRAVQGFRRMRRALIEDSGGPERVSAARLAVIDVLAQAAAIAREEFAAYVTNPGHDPARFTSLANAVIGGARQLGLERVAKDVPNLREYLEQAAARTEKAQAQRSRATPEDAPA
jgi:hypothetical protein